MPLKLSAVSRQLMLRKHDLEDLSTSCMGCDTDGMLVPVPFLTLQSGERAGTSCVAAPLAPHWVCLGPPLSGRDAHHACSSSVVRRILDRRKPGTAFVFLCLTLPRILSALYNIIHDCDEVYNYWEPLHFLLYGHGMQTWEYR